MAVTVKAVNSRREMREFIYLPEKLHARHQGWVPPIWSDENRIFDRTTNLSHQYCDSVYALAYESGKIAGRIAGIINKRYNQFQNVSYARFGYLESTDNPAVTSAMTNWVEHWAKDKGMTKIVGPMGFTEEDPEGFMIEGFDQVPNLATYQNFDYLNKHLELLGYSKEVDYVVYQVHFTEGFSERYTRHYNRVCNSKAFHLVDFRTRRQVERYIKPIFRLMNDCFAEIYGYSPLEDEEMNQLAGRYMPIIDPRFIKVAVNNEQEVVGFILGIPSIATGLIKAKGRLTPWGIYHILRARKTSTKLDTYIGCVKDTCRNLGVDTLLGYSSMESGMKAGFEWLDGHHQLELNHRIRAEMEFVGGKITKRYRIYQKSLV